MLAVDAADVRGIGVPYRTDGDRFGLDVGRADRTASNSVVASSLSREGCTQRALFREEAIDSNRFTLNNRR